MLTIDLYLFCVAIEGDFHQKIQANNGHMLIIRELGGSLYLLERLLK